MAEPALDRAAELLDGADALLVCAGAGMGVDSGLPDFRGDRGFWRAYPPYEELGIGFTDLASPVHFADDPALAWGFYGHRLALYRDTEPHRGFGALLRRGARLPGGVRVFTSNVDGQFQRAGFEHVTEVHGSIHHLQCATPCGEWISSAEETGVILDHATMRAKPPLPRCQDCGHVARPNILMFDDGAWIPDRTEAQQAELGRWRREQRGSRLVVVEVGAGTEVPTVRRMAELASAATGALIRINPREPDVRHGRGISLPLGALEALTELDERAT